MDILTVLMDAHDNQRPQRDKWCVITFTHIPGSEPKQETKRGLSYQHAMKMRDSHNRRGREIVAVIRDRED